MTRLTSVLNAEPDSLQVAFENLHKARCLANVMCDYIEQVAPDHLYDTHNLLIDLIGDAEMALERHFEKGRKRKAAPAAVA